MHERLKCKVQNHKTPRRKHKHNTLWHKVYQYCFGSVSKGKETSKNSQSVSQFSHIRLFATPWIAARQASLSITNSRSLLKLMSMLSYFKFWKMMLWKLCTQYASKFGKLSSGHRTGKGQFSFQSQRKAKTNKWDLITINIVCSAKETINKMKRQPKEWEKTFANDMTDKWFNVQNKQLINSISRNKQPD